MYAAWLCTRDMLLSQVLWGFSWNCGDAVPQRETAPMIAAMVLNIAADGLSARRRWALGLLPQHREIT